MLLDTHQNPIGINAAIFLVASCAVWWGGTRLTLHVDRISHLTGLGQVFAGMLLLGVITSLPEVANVITASSIGNPALALNNLLGSAAINIFLLAIGDTLVRAGALTSVVASPSTLMMSVLCILVLIMIAIAVTVGDVRFLGVGVWSVSITAVSVGSFWIASGYGHRSSWTVSDEAEDVRDKTKSEAVLQESLRAAIWRAGGLGLVIFLAGYALSQTGDAIAEQSGLGSGLVGFALIGIATSTPELSTVVQSVRIRRYEMAFGQILGTNFVNLSLFVLADAVYAGGPVIGELGQFEVLSALIGAVLIAIFLIGLLERRDATLGGVGYDSLTVILAFLFGLGLLAFHG